MEELFLVSELLDFAEELRGFRVFLGCSLSSLYFLEDESVSAFTSSRNLDSRRPSPHQSPGFGP